jgi:pimeloyl-ACP methyl ester carboxylesterase
MVVMTANDGTDEQHLEVRAGDGTPIAVWVRGSGPPLVMVHGSIADHTTLAGFVDVLEHGFTTYCLDRRGFGHTPDTTDYRIEQDFDDVVAVVAAAADRAGSPVTLFGHSYGAGCALGAAARSGRIGHLVLYEPGLGITYPPGVIERIEALLAAGDPEGAVEAVLVDVLEVSQEDIDVFRASPLWPRRIAAAGTIPRECRVEEAWADPGAFDGITARALFLTGSESAPELVAATRRAADAVPGAEIRRLEGHGHFAHRTDPEMVAGLIRDFVRA